MKLSKRVVTESGKEVRGPSHATSSASTPQPKRGLFVKTTNSVDPNVIEVGGVVRKAVKDELCKGPNGRHFIDTVLFDSLLPTLGFHMLSRTGHTDVTENFWFRLTYLLHSSNHLKYQELSLFYAFLRGILPGVVVSNLHDDVPGMSVMKLPSFTGSFKSLLDRRGWTYVHLDEALEMLIVRHLKSLSVTLLSHLENSAAWLMQVSFFRSLARRVTGASRAFGRFRGADDAGESGGTLQVYDRNTPQSRTVSAMLTLMRERGFLQLQHRGSEWLMNVFCDPPKRISKLFDQERILSINDYGKTTTALHLSVLFPDTFGRLTKQDREKYFGGRKFRKWTSYRKVPTARQAMMKEGGAALVSSDIVDTPPESETHTRRPKSNASALQLLSDRRRELSKAKDALHLAEREAHRVGDIVGRLDASSRWDKVHQGRHLISPKADAFFDPRGAVCHAQKSRMLKSPSSRGRTETFTLNFALPVQEHNVISRENFDYSLRSYFSIQLDVINAIHYRGDDGGRGTKLVEIVTAKMKRLLRKWITGERAVHLSQIHLHIDDPSLVISQKSSEQRRRDLDRFENGTRDLTLDIEEKNSLPGYEDELVIPWSHLLRNRRYKDELASLHLICGTVAAEELANEQNKRFSVYLHGGSFVLPVDFVGKHGSSFSMRRWSDIHPKEFCGKVFVVSSSSLVCDTAISKNFIAIPRDYPVILDTQTGLHIGDQRIQHGESETRFVAIFKQFILPQLSPGEQRSVGSRAVHPVSHHRELNRSHTPATTAYPWYHSSIIISDDTDVFFILLLSRTMEGYKVLHVLRNSTHDLDCALESIASASTDAVIVATLYAFAGCDFLPGTYGVPHEFYLKSYLQYVSPVGIIGFNSSPEVYETVMCLAYLYREGMTLSLTPSERAEMQKTLRTSVENGDLSRKEMVDKMKVVFLSCHEVGSTLWKVDVRNYIADRASSVNHLIPPTPHIFLQAARARFVIHHYWAQSFRDDLSPSRIGGCSVTNGYTENGEVIFESKEDVDLIKRDMKGVFSFCGCGGDCSTKRCSCQRKDLRCIGCQCSLDRCSNQIRTVEANELDPSDINMEQDSSCRRNLRTMTIAHNSGREPFRAEPPCCGHEVEVEEGNSSTGDLSEEQCHGDSVSFEASDEDESISKEQLQDIDELLLEDI